MTMFELSKNGPILISGDDIVIETEDGERAHYEGVVYICRCGGTKTPPFCDDSHGKKKMPYATIEVYDIPF